MNIFLATTAMYHDLFASLTPHDLILTVNQRLAAFLRHEHTLYQQTQNNKVWLTPNILPFSSWLSRCWEANQSAILLNTAQEQALWEQIIRNSAAGENLLQITTTAQMAKEAWQLTKQWQINSRSPLFAYSEDTAAWQQWAQQFQNLCHNNNWLDTNTVFDQIINLIKGGHLQIKGRVFLVGFDELNPQQQALVAALKNQNYSYQCVPVAPFTPRAAQISCTDTKTELHIAARWAHTLWQQNPHYCIGIIIPDLTAMRTQVLDVFTDVFAPESKLPGYITKPFAFNISAGLPLSEYPLIHTALKLLASIETPTQSILLPSQWAEIFSQHLRSVGWPGARTLDSTEYQLTERWTALLTEFAALDHITHKIAAQTASKQLNKLAATTIFQPESPPAPIQILGVLEASGLNFQHLWIMGLHEQAWPPPATPNPFIPLKVQRELGLRHASSARELEFCRILTQRLLHSAAQVIISYPQYEEDRQLQPSPLIHAIPTITQKDLNLSDCTSYAETIFASAQVEYFEDIYAPPLNSTEKIGGGTAIFKQQAACPFQAFARFRLGAQAMPNLPIGLSARERGSLLHHALEMLWNTLGGHAQLINHNQEQLQTIVDQVITITLAVFTKQRPDIFKKQFTQLEKQRLTHLLSQWLVIEKQRAPFTVVSTEQSQTYTINHLPLKLKVDRIDRLADGNHLIIDYKTGTATVNAWFGERPDEPQLLLYCLAYPLPISGLAFAQINNNTMQFKSITPDDVANWGKQIEEWRHTLEKLGDQFVQGYAKVDPKYGEKTCRLCDLSLLCRVGEPSPSG